MKKKCSQCKLEKDVSEFFKDKRTGDGLYSACKRCHAKYHKYEYGHRFNEYHNKWQKNNRAKLNEWHKKWRTKNKERVKESLRREWVKKREIPQNRVDGNMKCLIWLALKGKKAGRHWLDLVGYTLDDLTKHLERQFDDKMSWDNYGLYWSIDHIRPRSLFCYETAEDPEFKKCWALDNLRPLEKIANIKKGNRY